MQDFTRIQDILSLPCNGKCADCGKDCPNWSSTNIGIFICLRCAGVHRSFGTNISKVRSINLDVWTNQMIKRVAQIGNEKANSYWEYKLPINFVRPSWDRNEDVGAFIRDKYLNKKWAAPGSYNEFLNPKSLNTDTSNNKNEASTELPTFELLVPM